MDPPAQAVVLSIDEKSQIQALDRTQPGLPIKPGRCGTMTHDYKRHGTTTSFALQAAIKRYLAEHNADPKPSTWTASAASILAKLDRLPASSV